MEFRPWMIEASHDYLKASRLLGKNKLSVPSITTAAIGVEILFKSFLAEVDGLSGGIGEKYRFKKQYLRQLGGRNWFKSGMNHAQTGNLLENLG